jgi:hypothetical protein
MTTSWAGAGRLLPEHDALSLRSSFLPDSRKERPVDQNFFCVILVACLAWMVYMMTFRTDDWLRISAQHREHQREVFGALGKGAKAGLGIARFFLRK